MEVINISDAARRKGCNKNTVKLALYTGKIRGGFVSGKPTVIVDDDFLNWVPRTNPVGNPRLFKNRL